MSCGAVGLAATRCGIAGADTADKSMAITRVVKKAPAKVNIGLCVGGRNSNGYHNIISIFQAVSLCDTITAAVTDGVGCEVTCNGQPMQRDNTVERAYNAFAAVTGKRVGMSIDIEKKIPIGGGLGGGSSDAASSVCAFEELTGTCLSYGEKKAIAKRIGCDVYFFLLCGDTGCAAVTGLGDEVKPIRARDDIKMLLVFPPFGVSTAEAYSLLDSGRGGGELFASISADEMQRIYERPVKDWTFVNDFTPIVGVRFPLIAKTLDCMKEAGAVFCQMSGSGSTLYGVFDADNIEEAKLLLAERLGDDYCIKRVHPYGSHLWQKDDDKSR